MLNITLRSNRDKSRNFCGGAYCLKTEKSLYFSSISRDHFDALNTNENFGLQKITGKFAPNMV